MTLFSGFCEDFSPLTRMEAEFSMLEARILGKKLNFFLSLMKKDSPKGFIVNNREAALLANVTLECYEFFINCQQTCILWQSFYVKIF